MTVRNILLTPYRFAKYLTETLVRILRQHDFNGSATTELIIFMGRRVGQLECLLAHLYRIGEEVIDNEHGLDHGD